MTKPAWISALLSLHVAMLFGCAKESGPLPGDSVASDGAVTLSPPRVNTSPAEVRTESREALGPVESRLFPPELVMEHQAELAISPEQKKKILAETDRGQSEVLHLQWELQAEKEKLVKALDVDRVDEAKVQEVAAKVMDRETKVKAAHLGMLVRIKNTLSSDQQSKLRGLRTGVRLDAGAP